MVTMTYFGSIKTPQLERFNAKKFNIDHCVNALFGRSLF